MMCLPLPEVQTENYFKADIGNTSNPVQLLTVPDNATWPAEVRIRRRGSNFAGNMYFKWVRLNASETISATDYGRLLVSDGDTLVWPTPPRNAKLLMFHEAAGSWTYQLEISAHYGLSR